MNDPFMMDSQSPTPRSEQYHQLQMFHANRGNASPRLPVSPRFHYDARNSSLSSEEADTVVRWQTPPQSPKHLPDPPKDRSHAHIRDRGIGRNVEADASQAELVVRFDEDQIRSTEVEAEQRTSNMVDRRDDTPPTPTMDDTPYIRFAIEQLTIDDDASLKRISDESSILHLQSPRVMLQSPRMPFQAPITPMQTPPRASLERDFNHVSPEREREALRLVRKHRSTPSAEGRLFNFNATRPLSIKSEPEPAIPMPSRISAIFIPMEPSADARQPDLTFLPIILRPFSMITLALLCLLMTAALMFCAIYSSKNNGLLEWRAGIYGVRYFLFGFVPQILAAIVFVYVQAVMAAITRVLPFTLMANEEADHRKDAIFLGIFPRTLLFPRWEGPLSCEVAQSAFWLTVFTIPLQSSLFSVILVDNNFRWTTVQSVAWLLVGIYMLVFLATVVFGVFFFRRTTGLMWDPVSLADIMSMLPRSNCFNDYTGTDVMRTKVELKERLAAREDRLGYWRTQNKQQGMFYCLGENGAATRRRTMSPSRLLDSSFERSPVLDIEKRSLDFSRIRFRQLPWFLRDTFVTLWLVAAVILLGALFVVSFLPQTAVRNGFPAATTVVPNSTGFSAANFLYSFVPSIIGMLLYICSQSLDMAVRKRQPWADLTKQDGATASRSLLLDYPSRQSFSCTFKALMNGHFRVAALSLFSGLFIVLPILAGGLFFPLTATGRVVRIFPNLPAYYIILGLLALFLVGLIMIAPGRRMLGLPHEADCVAEIISFVYASGILEDAPFRAPKSKEDLVMRLNAVGARGEGKTFGFGVIRDKRDKEVLNIDRLARPGNNLAVLDPKAW